MLSCGWLYLGKHFIIINKKKEKKKENSFLLLLKNYLSWTSNILIQMYSVIDGVNHLLPKTSLV